MMKDVSIVIVNYNTCQVTLDCIDSICRETSGVDYEIIVVDNNSTDGNHAFTLFNYLLGDNDSPYRDPTELSATSGIRAYVFYTFVGDYYLDFGPIGGYIAIIIQGLLLFVFVRNYNRKSTVYNLIWISMILRILVPGFTYFTYMNNVFEILATPIINFIFILTCKPKGSCFTKGLKV